MFDCIDIYMPSPVSQSLALPLLTTQRPPRNQRKPTRRPGKQINLGQRPGKGPIRVRSAKFYQAWSMVRGDGPVRVFFNFILGPQPWKCLKSPILSWTIETVSNEKSHAKGHIFSIRFTPALISWTRQRSSQAWTPIKNSLSHHQDLMQVSACFS